MADDTRTFLVRVTVKRAPSNEVEGDGWFAPEDFVSFLRKRFTVPADADYGLDAYNKRGVQLVVGVERATSSPLTVLTCAHCSRIVHRDPHGAWRDNLGLATCDEVDGNHTI